MRENPLSPYTTDYRNVFFTDFVTPLRGFRMNKLSGESYLLFNAELRWPVFRVLSRGPLTSTFLQNFQLTAFTDVGTAWTGNGPFSRQNSLNTEIVSAPGSVWTATVNNFKNPYLIGYGVGVRTLFLGYYVKGDFAWGVEDKTTQTPILHISLGHDF
ncbi:BamA/TamA family outer membrane protein [Siphonobacter sp. SORGH_AS_0500]|uniref:BamA/TamA family outer membrane protein n=1 Tax=Siphonobacter sp. SORGH_AS_0500 TaxID=1864824 RepID=UPI0028678118|nr:BamA/TamA family outer membrane protein [Siphonobacter sp. SORGH_AS_0500]MDR6194178.1 hemolysin activation/secretion protein [Siphonobacter sp. SORGH_AS_0500]